MIRDKRCFPERSFLKSPVATRMRVPTWTLQTGQGLIEIFFLPLSLILLYSPHLMKDVAVRIASLTADHFCTNIETPRVKLTALSTS